VSIIQNGKVAVPIEGAELPFYQQKAEPQLDKGVYSETI